MKHVFIVNPVAGKKDAGKKLIPEIIRAASNLELPYEVILTEAPGHATALAETYAQAEDEVRLYACGGDGTFHEVVQGAWLYPNAAIGCIPCGSGNDFVRNFTHKEDFLDIAAMLQGRVVNMDLVETPEGYSTSSCSVGLDAQVAMGIDKWRRVPGCGGSVSYLLSAVEQVMGKLGLHLKIRLDDTELEGEYLLAAACNGKAYGGGFMAAPPARLDDGEMDVLLVKKISRLKIAGVIGAYREGAHLKNSEVSERFRDIITYTRAKRIEITAAPGEQFAVNVDGETFLRNHMTAKICPRAARIILPESAYADHGAAEKADSPAVSY